MRRNRLIAIAIAGALASPFAAQAIDRDPATGGAPVPPVGHPGKAARGDSTVGGASGTVAPGTGQGAAAGATGAGGGQVQFESLDANRDGFITRQEASRSRDVSGRFEALDTDRDGKLSPTEFGATGTPSASQ